MNAAAGPQPEQEEAGGESSFDLGVAEQEIGLARAIAPQPSGHLVLSGAGVAEAARTHDVVDDQGIGPVRGEDNIHGADRNRAEPSPVCGGGILVVRVVIVMKVFLFLTSVLLAAAAMPRAKNVLVFLGDAGGIPTLHAASIHGYRALGKLFIQ